MLFMFERGNNIIIALILSLIFVTFYKSDKVLVRELSLIALSAAIAIKIYPIVFCALLVREKRIKELLRTALYSILLFVVPFFIFYDGLGSIKLLLANLSNYGNITNLSTGTQLNFAKMPILPLSLFDISNDMLLRIGDAFKVVVMFAAVLASFFVDREWKAAAVCCCIIYGYQSTCATYLLVMFCIPVILMLDSEKEHSPKSYVYISLMILSLGLIVSLNPVTGEFSRYIGTKISSYAIMILTFMLIYDGINGFCGWAAKITGLKKKTAVLFTALILSAVLANVLFIAPGSIFDLINIKFLTSSLIKNLLVCFTAAAVLIGAVFLVWFFRRRDEDDGLGLARQFLKFGLVGISNTLISLIVYYIFFFISPKLYFAGNVAGFVVSVFNAYYWNNKYVFKASGESRLKTILKTFAAYGATFILSSVLLVVMVELLGVRGL